MSAGIRTGIMAFTDTDALPIASDAVTISQTVNSLTPETSTTDDLATISIESGLSGELGTYRPIVILLGTSGNTITIKHGTGNIVLNAGGDLSLGATDALMLFYDGTNWHDLGY